VLKSHWLDGKRQRQIDTYISLTNLFNHCTQGGTRASGDKLTLFLEFGCVGKGILRQL